MMVFDEKNKYWYSSLINDATYFSGFSTKVLGDARDVQNLISFFRQQEVSYDSLVVPEQIHSTNVHIITNDELHSITRVNEVDGVVTSQQNVMLTVQTADCVPIILVDKTNGVIGVSHQGWRGSLKRMAHHMVEAMKKEGAISETLCAAIGPAIGMCCYTIDEDRYAEFMYAFEPYAKDIFVQHGSKKYLNLSRLNYLLLREVGIPANHIDFFPFCTSCDKERFFSYRRDTTEEFGKMFHFILRRGEGMVK